MTTSLGPRLLQFRTIEVASFDELQRYFVDPSLAPIEIEFLSAVGADLLSHRLKVPLHPINTDRNAIDERERLRVLGEHGSKVSGKRHVRAHEHAIPTGHRQAHALVVGVSQPDREAASFHLGCEIEHTKSFHAVQGYRILIMDDSDVTSISFRSQGPLRSHTRKPTSLLHASDRGRTRLWRVDLQRRA
jgi:hypothetical protein